MSSPQKQDESVCPACGLQNTFRDGRCYHCGHTIERPEYNLADMEEKASKGLISIFGVLIALIVVPFLPPVTNFGALLLILLWLTLLVAFFALIARWIIMKRRIAKLKKNLPPGKSPSKAIEDEDKDTITFKGI